MTLNTDHLKRCIGTLEMSLVMYEEATPESIDQEVFRNAIVKGYELTQETGFKLLKRALKDFGQPPTTTAKASPMRHWSCCPPLSPTRSCWKPSCVTDSPGRNDHGSTAAIP